MKTISSRQNAIVRTFRTLAAEPSDTRLLLDGVRIIDDAFASGAAFETVAVSSSAIEDHDDIGALARRLEKAGTPVVGVSAPVLRALSPVRAPSGIVAIARRRPTSLSEVCSTRPAAFVLAVADVQDPGNLGSLLRSAEAAGATGALVCGASASPFSWKAARGSMGSILRLPIAVEPSVTTAIQAMRAAGLRTIAAAPREGQPPDGVDWRGSVGLLLGGEGAGLGTDVLDACDALVTIPMTAPVESLNVAAAGAVLCYAAKRQRT